MKIVIDARFWGPSHTGLGVYTQKLVENLSLADSKNEYVVLLRKDVFETFKLSGNIHKILLDVNPYSLEEQVKLPLILANLKPDLVHFPSINVPVFYFGKYVVTVHDLIKQQSRGISTTTHNPFFYWVKYFLYLVVFRVLLYFSRKIIVPSNSVKAELMKFYGVSNDKIVRTYEGPSLYEKLKKARVNTEEIALYTGNAYPHKNLLKLIRAWKRIYGETQVKLVLVSGRSVFSERIAKLITSENAQNFVKLTGFLNDNELMDLYSKAKVYVFPSLMEGFGIPGLDAMQAGVPLICSDIPVFHEVYGDAAEYFDPVSQSDIEEKIIALLSNLSGQKNLIAKGFIQVKKYSWEKMAAETLETYESCLSI